MMSKSSSAKWGERSTKGGKKNVRAHFLVALSHSPAAGWRVRVERENRQINNGLILPAARRRIKLISPIDRFALPSPGSGMGDALDNGGAGDWSQLKADDTPHGWGPAGNPASFQFLFNLSPPEKRRPGPGTPLTSSSVASSAVGTSTAAVSSDGTPLERGSTPFCTGGGLFPPFYGRDDASAASAVPGISPSTSPPVAHSATPVSPLQRVWAAMDRAKMALALAVVSDLSPDLLDAAEVADAGPAISQQVAADAGMLVSRLRDRARLRHLAMRMHDVLLEKRGGAGCIGDGIGCSAAPKQPGGADDGEASFSPDSPAPVEAAASLPWESLLLLRSEVEDGGGSDGSWSSLRGLEADVATVSERVAAAEDAAVALTARLVALTSHPKKVRL